VATAQLEADAKIASTGDAEANAGGVSTAGNEDVAAPATEEAAVPTPSNRRFFGVVRLEAERYGRDFNRVAQEIVQHLTAVDGTHIELTVEIKATNDEGFPADKVR